MAKREKTITGGWMTEIPNMKIDETAKIPDSVYDYVMGSVKQRLRRRKNIEMEATGEPRFFINGIKYFRIKRLK